jgi:uncharacterized phosphosugar-binding protein
MRTILLRLATILLTICFTSRCRGENPVDLYAQRVFELVSQQQQDIPRLFEPAEVTARSLMAGGAFYLAGDPGWVSEGTGRAGGLLSTSPLPTVEQFKQLGEMFGEAPHGVVVQKGDVVWLSYSSTTYAGATTTAKDLEQKGCVVVAFGPRPPDGPPAFPHWIDSLTPWAVDANFTRMGNVLSLWTSTAEVASNTARQGRTLGFYQSLVIYGARERNDLYISQRPYKGSIVMSYPPLSAYHTGVGTAFHDGIPSMKAVQAGVLAGAYLDYISNMLREIKDKELENIIKVGREMARRASESHPAALMVLGHLMPYAVSRDGKLFHYLDLKNDTKNLQDLNLQDSLGSDGYFVWIGYVATPLDLWNAVRRAGAHAVWIVAPLPAEVDFRQFGDVVINERWPIGDGAVNVPGYDVRILPPSGLAQLFIYELLVRAGGAS